MTDRPESSPWLRLLGGFFVSASLAFSPQVLAQEESDDEEDEVEVTEEITVTGSRLKRDTYSSIAPLQIISGQISREVGLIDAASILQESTASAGQQVDLTFSGFVLDNGPGASTINLRGLGEARTLVLINGRRLAPAGVEGAPFAPNINLVPASMVQQYDLLLDGASSVYGSDAIAGVANVILRKDFDGFEIEGYSRVPHHDKGLENTLSIAWGKNFDRGFVGMGYEYFDAEEVTLEDRPWTEGCERNHEIDENGQIRTEEVFDRDVYGMEVGDCRRAALAARIFQFGLRSGSIYYTPGFSNGGWNNFSESSDFSFGIDSDQDGSADLSFRDYDLNGKPASQATSLFPETETQSFMAYGEYTFAGEANITPYFEALYSSVDFFNNSGAFQFFPDVPANNPLNVCNPNAPGGIDCGLAQDALYTSAHYIASFQNQFAGFCDSIGVPLASCTPATFGFITGGVGAVDVEPIVSVVGDRVLNYIDGDQIRVVGGVRGDLPFMSAGSLDNWTFDAYYSYSKSDATSSRPGIRDDRINLALGWFSSTNTPCENDLGVELAADAAPGCVPVDMFAPSLYPVGVVAGDFATQAERDYLFDSRDFRTKYEQAVGSLYATGDIFEMPGGPVAFGIGVETRKDEINSLPDQVAADGLLFGFFADGGAVGDKTTNEAFAELEMPLLAGVPGAQELTANFSSRFTDDEIYGGNWTWSGKLGYRPTDALLLRGTFGTAFRAPNLRELYLQDQSGFNNGLFDPCFVPEGAINDVTGEYDPALDNREPEVFTNCAANGVDATQAVGFGRQIYSAEVATGGSLTLDPEKSESWSVGLSWDQPFTNAFNFNLSATYYEVEVRNTIIEPSSQFIVNDCYTSLTGNSAFCDRIIRDLSDPTAPFIDLIEAGFINRDSETARGLDINIAFDDTFTVFNRPIDIGLDIVANRQFERNTLFVDEEGNRDFDEFVGEWGFPEWRVQNYLRLDYDDYRFVYEMRYTSSVIQDPAGVDDFDEAITGGSNSCSGPPDDVLCRDYADTGNYFLHNISLYYYGDRWTFGGGIRNLLDEKPPVVDGTEIQSINNTPIGYGYDLRGRTYFLNVAVNFGGDM